MILQHLPAIQVLIPFFAALLVALIKNINFTWIVSTTVAGFSLFLSVFALQKVQHGILYAFGNWPTPIGIEYRLDNLSQLTITFTNFALFFFLLFSRNSINSSILKHITPNKQNYFFFILLMGHAGFLGMASTNDIFNLYVFIEISSLATYTLIAQGKSPAALVGAFDYLMLGTIGATLILIGIGIFLGLTGSLNVSDIAYILSNYPNSQILSAAIAFFLVGAILKMALYPMHFWMIRAYNAAPSSIISYLAPVTTIIGTYVITRFIFFVIDISRIQNIFLYIIKPTALVTIVICTFLAIRATNFKKIIIYSSASQIGYIFLLMTIPNSTNLMFILVLLDGLNKIALFSMISSFEADIHNLTLKQFNKIKFDSSFKIMSALVLLFSAGLPLTSMFLIKAQIFSTLMQEKLWSELLIVILGSVTALLYHFKLAKAIFFNKEEKSNKVVKLGNHASLFAVIILQFLTLVYINQLSDHMNLLEYNMMNQRGRDE